LRASKQFRIDATSAVFSKFFHRHCSSAAVPQPPTYADLRTIFSMLRELLSRFCPL
jgi:hypothetical protein